MIKMFPSRSLSGLLSALLVAATCITPSLRAQIATQKISLSEKWNAVWLEVEPVYVVGDTVHNDPADEGDNEILASDDLRVGQPKAPQDVFSNPAIVTIASPKPLAGLAEFFAKAPGSVGTFNQDEWQQWLRTDPVGTNNLPKIYGNRAYLVEVSTGTPAFSLEIKGSARFFRPTWTPDRYNLIGFGLAGTPTFDSFFGPSGGRHGVSIEGEKRIFRLNNGEWQAVPNGSDTMASNEAYWIFCNGTSDYMGPVAVDFDFATVGSLNFGGPGDAVPVGNLDLDLKELVFTNRGSAAAVPSLDLISGDSDDPPLLDLHVVTPAVGTLGYELGNQIDSSVDAGGSSPLGELVVPESTAVLTLGARRNWSSGKVGRTNLYRLTTSNPGAQVWLPVTARKNNIQLPTDNLPDAGAVAGLWVGEVIFDAVTSIVEDGEPVRASAGTAPMRILLHSGGAVSLLNQVTIMQTKTADLEVAPVPVLVVDPTRIPYFEGVKERNGKRVGLRLQTVAYDMPRKFDAESQGALLGSLTQRGEPTFLSLPCLLYTSPSPRDRG